MDNRTPINEVLNIPEKGFKLSHMGRPSSRPNINQFNRRPEIRQEPHMPMVFQHNHEPRRISMQDYGSMVSRELPGIRDIFNCLDISKHVKDCPICTKFYNNDKSLYVMTIVVLTVICILLLKKILEK